MALAISISPDFSGASSLSPERRMMQFASVTQHHLPLGIDTHMSVVEGDLSKPGIQFFLVRDELFCNAGHRFRP